MRVQDEPLRIRQSSIRLFLSCRRSWWMTYADAYQPRAEEEADANGRANLGTLVHAGLESHYKDDGSDPFRAMIDLVPIDDTIGAMSDAWAKELKWATVMLEGYLEWVELEGKDIGRKVIATERSWEVPYYIRGQQVIVHGTSDLTTREALYGNRVVITDHKTVQNYGNLPRQVDWQLLTYALAYWRVSGEVPTRVEHNMLRKVLRTKPSDIPFYDRFGLAITEEQLEKHEKHLLVVLDEMVGLWQSVSSVDDPRLYPNPSAEHCRFCNFKELCSVVDDGDWEHVLELNYERPVVSPQPESREAP